jgi:thiazole/oxazole-forming peptide maturase SagD family component
LLGEAAPVQVDTFLSAYAQLQRGAGTDRPRSSYLLLDFHRLVVYHDPPEPGAATVAAVLHALADDYPHQPLLELLPHAGAEYRHLTHSGALDVLAWLWPNTRPGKLVVCDLLTGAISTGCVPPHPRASTWAAPVPPAAATPPPPVLPADRWTGPSLRERPLPDLWTLLHPSAGPVRQLQQVLDAADLPLATARLSYDGGGVTDFCHGKHLVPLHAAATALCEAAERWQIAYRPADEVLVNATAAELGEVAVQPRAATDASDGDPNATQPWTWATDLVCGRAVLVPAREVWFRTGVRSGAGAALTTTSGCALGASAEEATIFALLESVERDAFLTAWYTRRRFRGIIQDSVAHEPFQLLRRRLRITHPNYDFVLFDATTDIGIPTVTGVAVRRRGSGPRTFHAAATRFSAGDACYATLRDLTGFAQRLSPARRSEAGALLDAPARTGRPDDHYLLYTLDETWPRLAFMGIDDEPSVRLDEVDAMSPVHPAERHNLRTVLEALVDRIYQAGAGAIVKDITHARIADLGLCCVRVLTPGLYPIWFGTPGPLPAITDRLRRLGALWTGRPLAGPLDLNLEIHPFS